MGTSGQVSLLTTNKDKTMRTMCLYSAAILLVSGCLLNEPTAKNTPKVQDKGVEAMTQPIVDRDALKALLGMELPTFVTRYGIKPGQIRTNVSYEGLKPVTAVHNPTVSPAHFYFRGDKLVLIYIGQAEALASLSSQQLWAQLGGRGRELQSRAGKTSNLHVYASQGFAVSVGDAVDFYELFAPSSDDEYIRDIYVQQEPFRK